MIGIYKLLFANSCAYIGQSINIERRKKQHFYGMKSGKHHNKNIVDMFNKHGEPDFLILEECAIELLNERELHYASIERLNLLNTASIPGTSDPDTVLHHNKKYSKKQIISVAEMLADKYTCFEEIEKITGVNKSTVAAISMGEAHGWLESCIPEIFYTIKQHLGNRQKAVGKKYTEEQIYEVLVYLGMPKISHREISEITDIPKTVIQSISAQYSYTDLANKYPEEYKRMLDSAKVRKLKEEIVLISPKGDKINVTNRSAFARTYNLRKASILDLCNGKIKSYKGWTIQND